MSFEEPDLMYPELTASQDYDEDLMETKSNESSGGGYECHPNGTLVYPTRFGVGGDNNTPVHASEVHPLGACFYEQTCYYINGSTWNGPAALTVPIYGYIMPIILIFTIICNLLIIIVLSKKHMRTPTNMVLMAMAISDLLTILCPEPWYFWVYTLGNMEPLSTAESGFAFEAMLENCPQIFHTASIWLTLALALQRWIYVCRANTARDWCSMKNTKIGIAIIFILAFLHQVPRFFDRNFETIYIEYPICTGEFVHICKVTFADWVVNVVTMNAYFITFWTFRILFVHWIPCISLVILNFLLFRAMRDAEKKRARLLNSNRKVNVIKGESKESKKIRDANTTTLMLIVVISVFLCVEVPLGAIVVLHVLSSSISTDFLNYEVVRAVILVVNMMISLSYPLNFGIYCGMSKQFRDTFTELFIKRVTRRNSMQMFETDGATRPARVGGQNHQTVPATTIAASASATTNGKRVSVLSKTVVHENKKNMENQTLPVPDETEEPLIEVLHEEEAAAVNSSNGHGNKTTVAVINATNVTNNGQVHETHL